MRSLLMAGNWKMNLTIAESTALARAVKDGLGEPSVTVMVAPSFTALASVGEVIRESRVYLGAQNMAPEPKGAHTGEISAAMLKEVGVSYVILGHSERRHTYLEPDDLINMKVRLALEEGLRVVLCVGETLEERERHLAEEVVENQLTRGLKASQRRLLQG